MWNLLITNFSRAVLEMQWSNGLHDMGYPKWQLVVCLVLIYCMLYISLFKGVKSSGKFTAYRLFCNMRDSEVAFRIAVTLEIKRKI